MTVAQRWPLAGDPNEKIGTQQHIVPREYLRYFSDERNSIAVVDRETGRRFTTSINRPGAAVERDFNTFVNIDGELDGRLDHLLTHVERGAFRTLKNLVEGAAFVTFPPPADDREAMCIFLAFQMTRGRKLRRRTEILADVYTHIMIPTHMTSEQAAAMLETRGIEPTPEAVQELVAFSTDMDEIEIVADPNDHLRLIGPLARELFENLITRSWYVLEFDDPSLITCDDPVVQSFDDDNPQQSGLLNADDVVFPLCPNQLLVLARFPDGPERRIKAQAGLAPEINLMIAANAYAEIYLHPEQHHLDDLTLPGPEPMFHFQAAPQFGLTRFNQPVARRRTARRSD